METYNVCHFPPQHLFSYLCFGLQQAENAIHWCSSPLQAFRGSSGPKRAKQLLFFGLPPKNVFRLPNTNLPARFNTNSLVGTWHAFHPPTVLLWRRDPTPLGAHDGPLYPTLLPSWTLATLEKLPQEGGGGVPAESSTMAPNDLHSPSLQPLG